MIQNDLGKWDIQLKKEKQQQQPKPQQNENQKEQVQDSTLEEEQSTAQIKYGQ